jgi:cation diffusion facilitator family transporter
VLWFVLALNVAVALAKLAYGVLIGSVAMQADGFHSLFDGTSNVIGLVGVTLAARAADETHPYGHSKYESLAAAAIGALLLVAAWRVGSQSIERLLDPGPGPRVDGVAFGIMAVTLVINGVVAFTERRAGARLGSEVLIADSQHTASDVLVSLGVVGGLLAVRLGIPWADPAIGLVVAGFIVLAAIRVFRSADATFSDRARLPSDAICDVVLSVPGVLGCHDIRTRGSASEVYVDLHVQVDASATVGEGHQIAEAVERAVCEGFPQVIDVIAHLEPCDAYQRQKTVRERSQSGS